MRAWMIFLRHSGGTLPSAGVPSCGIIIDDLAVEDLRIGFEGLLAIAVEGEIGIGLHDALLVGFLASAR